MARRYDSRTTIFSPEGRLYQVEYAMEAISNAGAALGVLASDGVVLAAEKRITSKLLDTNAIGVRREKMYQLDGHIGCAVAGITADANILINSARLAAQRHAFAFGEPVPVEQLVRALCDAKQGYTQFGGLRPYGVSLLYAGWDRERGFQLYQSDPSGNYSGWKATAVGAGAAAAQAILRADYHKKKKETKKEGGGEEDKGKEKKAEAGEGGEGDKEKKRDEADSDEMPDIEAALALAVKVLSKTMDSAALTADKVELSTVTRDAETGYVRYKVYDAADLAPLLEAANVEAAKAKEAEEK